MNLSSLLLVRRGYILRFQGLRIASLGEEQPELVHAHALGVLPAHAADRALDERGLLLLQLVDAHLVLGFGFGFGLGLGLGFRRRLVDAHLVGTEQCKR